MGEELEEAELEEESLDEEPVILDGEGQEGHNLNHEHGDACMQAAEELETKVGLYDDGKPEVMERLAAEFHEAANMITGKKSDTFKDVFHQRLKSVSEKMEAFGA